MIAPNNAELLGNEGEQEDEIIFSSRDGYVWASWTDSEATVRLGRHQMVVGMMQNFLAQDALGQRFGG